MAGAHDPETLAFYDREADPYARHDERPSPHLGAFLDGLSPGARILELGCGAGATPPPCSPAASRWRPPTARRA